MGHWIIHCIVHYPGKTKRSKQILLILNKFLSAWLVAGSQNTETSIENGRYKTSKVKNGKTVPATNIKWGKTIFTKYTLTCVSMQIYSLNKIKHWNRYLFRLYAEHACCMEIDMMFCACTAYLVDWGESLKINSNSTSFLWSENII